MVLGWEGGLCPLAKGLSHHRMGFGPSSGDVALHRVQVVICGSATSSSCVEDSGREDQPGEEEMGWKAGPEVKVRGDVPD